MGTSFTKFEPVLEDEKSTSSVVNLPFNVLRTVWGFAEAKSLPGRLSASTKTLPVIKPSMVR
jgi:hypothetical protein